MAVKAHSRPRGLFLFFFLTVALNLTLSPVMSLARSPYKYTSSSEGDPGDGVLRPAPDIVNPEPSPTPRAHGLIMTLDGIPLLPGGYMVPLWPQTLISSLEYSSFGERIPGQWLPGRSWSPEGGWRNAP